jgi:hypothetical protein
MFLRGLQEGGVPIKFSSWHTFQFTTGGATQVNLQVQERSRSVKALFCCQTLTPPKFETDSHATLNSSTANGFMVNYQYRIGGRYIFFYYFFLTLLDISLQLQFKVIWEVLLHFLMEDVKLSLNYRKLLMLLVIIDYRHL